MKMKLFYTVSLTFNVLIDRHIKSISVRKRRLIFSLPGFVAVFASLTHITFGF